MTIAEMSKQELVYLRFLEQQENADYEMEYKLAVLFALPEKTAAEEVETYLNFRHSMEKDGE